MSETEARAGFSRGIGVLLLVAGVAVFLIRFQHPGPYAPPEEGNLRAALLALAVGAALYWLPATEALRRLRRVLLLVSPVILFFALYSTLAELEEVIVVSALRDGEPVDLRLWVIDIDGAPWVTMPGAKADAHALDGARVDFRRDGETRCVEGMRFDDRETVNRVHRLRHEKYFVQRLATQIGLFGRDAGESEVAVRFDTCTTRE